MAKAGKLGKLLKKMQSIGRTSFNREIDHHHQQQQQHHNNNTSSSSRRRSSTSSSTVAAYDTEASYSANNTNTNTNNNNNNVIVYVGKCRRRYMVSPDVVDHPLFRELVERSPDAGGAEDISVNCEVVLFEHMLWMLENADPQAQQDEPLDELVDFYAY